MITAFVTTEAIRTAMQEFGNQPLTGEQVQRGLAHLNITPQRIQDVGSAGLVPPFKVSCRNHEGGGGVRFQQWDGTKWKMITDGVATDQALVWPLIEASAAQYAQEKGITPRDCP